LVLCITIREVRGPAHDLVCATVTLLLSRSVYSGKGARDDTAQPGTTGVQATGHQLSMKAGK
jgi:hypothetical protein